MTSHAGDGTPGPAREAAYDRLLFAASALPDPEMQEQMVADLAVLAAREQPRRSANPSDDEITRVLNFVSVQMGFGPHVKPYPTVEAFRAYMNETRNLYLSEGAEAASGDSGGPREAFKAGATEAWWYEKGWQAGQEALRAELGRAGTEPSVWEQAAKIADEHAALYRQRTADGSEYSDIEAHACEQLAVSLRAAAAGSGGRAGPMTDAEVIAAIRANHLKANISHCEDRAHWDRAWIDPGGTIFGPGPYAKVPIALEEGDEIVVRVYPPERLRKKLAAKWPVRAPASDPREGAHR